LRRLNVQKKRVRKTRKVVKKTKKVRRVRKVKVPKKKVPGFCRSNGDPHFSTFTGVNFDNYMVGDFTLLSHPLIEIHVRQVKWGGAAVNIKFAARVNFQGDYFQVNSQDSVLLNGRKIKLAIGQTVKARNGGFIKRYNQERFKVTAVNGAFVDTQVNKAPKGVKWPQTHYINMLVWVPSTKKTKGFCVSKDQVLKASGLFKNYRKPHKVRKIKCSAANLKKATARCVAAKVMKKHLKDCARDVCLSNGTLDPKQITRFEKRCNKDKKKFKKIVVRKTAKPKKVACFIYADPHVRDKYGRHFEAQTVGDWAITISETFKAYYRGKSMGRWVAVVDWIVKTNGVTIRHSGFGGVAVDGGKIQLLNGKPFALPTGGSIIKKGNMVTIKSGDGEEIDFISYGKFYNVYVRSNKKGTKGLCNKQFLKTKVFPHPRKGVILPKVKINAKTCKKFLKHSTYCRAKGLNGVKLRECIQDLCLKLPKKIEKQILKDNKKEKRKRMPKGKNPKVPKKKLQPLKRVTEGKKKITKRR